MPLSEFELCRQVNLNHEQELSEVFNTSCLMTIVTEYFSDFLRFKVDAPEPSLPSIIRCLFASHRHPGLPWAWTKVDPGFKDGWNVTTHAARFAYRYLSHFPPLGPEEWTEAERPPRRVVAATEVLRYLHCLGAREVDLSNRWSRQVWSNLIYHQHLQERGGRVCETVENHWNEPDADCDLFRTIFVWPYGPL